MNSLVKRGLGIAAVGLSAVAMSGCSFIAEAANEGADCSTLSSAVKEHEPDATTAIGDWEEKDFDALTDWMKNSKGEFNDKKFGENVVTWGELGEGYYHDTQKAEPLSEADHKKFEEASDAIAETGKECKDSGFGVTGAPSS